METYLKYIIFSIAALFFFHPGAMMKRILLAFLFLISHLAADDIWNTFYIESVSDLEANKNEDALGKIDACINLKESNRDFWYWNAVMQKSYIFSNMEKYKESIELCEKIIKNSKSNCLQNEAYSLLTINYMNLGEAKKHINAMVDQNRHLSNFKTTSYGKKSVLGYIQDPLSFSLSKLKCFLIHLRLTYGKDDVKQISPNTYVYTPFCWCGCEDSQSKIKDYCDECGKPLDKIPSIEEIKKENEEIEKIFYDLGLDFKEYHKAIEEAINQNFGKTQIENRLFLTCGIDYPAMLPNVVKSTCSNGCWMAGIAAIKWCEHKYTDFSKKSVAIGVVNSLTNKCYECCQSKNDMLACTAPFQRLAKFVYNAVSEAQSGHSKNWQCKGCGYFNINEGGFLNPFYQCRSCYRMKDFDQ